MYCGSKLAVFQHCKQKGVHNTNNYCLEKINKSENKTEKTNKGQEVKNRVKKVTSRSASPAGRNDAERENESECSSKRCDNDVNLNDMDIGDGMSILHNNEEVNIYSISKMSKIQ